MRYPSRCGRLTVKLRYQTSCKQTDNSSTTQLGTEGQHRMAPQEQIGAFAFPALEVAG